jgi:hypothetical protein
MKIFVAGPRAISSLNKSVKDRLYGIFEKEHAVLVGDANGVDKAVQNFFSELNYSSVTVYASNGRVRNNLGKWPVQSVQVPAAKKGFDFYAAKDKAMAEAADYGFMIWNGESKGTLNNVVNLLSENKKVLVYFNPGNIFINIDNYDKLDTLMGFCSEDTKMLLNKLLPKPVVAQTQISLFESNAL